MIHQRPLFSGDTAKTFVLWWYSKDFCSLVIHSSVSCESAGWATYAVCIYPNKLFDAQHKKKALMTYVNSEGPDECAHPCSLMRTFSVCWHVLQYPLIMVAGSEGPDQTVWMGRLIRACIVHKVISCANAQADQSLHCPQCVRIFFVCCASFGFVEHMSHKVRMMFMMIMMSSGLTSHQPMRVICIKMVNYLGFIFWHECPEQGSYQSAHLYSLISLCPHKGILHPWLSKMRSEDSDQTV